MDYTAMAAAIGNKLQSTGQTAITLADELRTAKVNKARLEELKRKQALGALGLTDEEIARANDMAVSPVQAQLREMNLRNQIGTEVQDVGGGVAARTALASQDEQTRALNEAGKVVEDANEQARQAQLNEIVNLEKAPKAGAAWAKAIIGELTDMGGKPTAQAISSGIQGAQQKRADTALQAFDFPSQSAQSVAPTSWKGLYGAYGNKVQDNTYFYEGTSAYAGGF